LLSLASCAYRARRFPSTTVLMASPRASTPNEKRPRSSGHQRSSSTVRTAGAAGGSTTTRFLRPHFCWPVTSAPTLSSAVAIESFWALAIASRQLCPACAAGTVQSKLTTLGRPHSSDGTSFAGAIGCQGEDGASALFGKFVQKPAGRFGGPGAPPAWRPWAAGSVAAIGPRLGPCPSPRTVRLG